MTSSGSARRCRSWEPRKLPEVGWALNGPPAPIPDCRVGLAGSAVGAPEGGRDPAWDCVRDGAPGCPPLMTHVAGKPVITGCLDLARLLLLVLDASKIDRKANMRPTTLTALLPAAVLWATPAVAFAQYADDGYGTGPYQDGYATEPYQDTLEARVWLDRGPEAVVEPGDDVRVYYRTSDDAYAAIFRIDTDGRISLVYPQHPDMDPWVVGGRDYRLLFADSPRWRVREDPGVGYFFMVASQAPLDFSAFGWDDDYGWDLRGVGETVYEDPYVAIDDYVAAVLPTWETSPYALDFLEYSVGEDHDYPRFICYDCHGFRSYARWDPYAHACSSYQVVIWDDPYFQPRFRYVGTRVVFARPIGPRPRYGVTARIVGSSRGPIVRTRAAPPRRIATFKESPRRGSLLRTSPRPSSSLRAPAARTPRSAAPRSVTPSRADERPTLQRRLPSSRREPAAGSRAPRTSPGARGAPDARRAPGSRSAPGAARGTPSGRVRGGPPPSSGSASRPSRPAPRGRPAPGGRARIGPPSRPGSMSRPSARPPRGGSSRPEARPAPRTRPGGASTRPPRAAPSRPPGGRAAPSRRSGGDVRSRPPGSGGRPSAGPSRRPGGSGSRPAARPGGRPGSSGSRPPPRRPGGRAPGA